MKLNEPGNPVSKHSMQSYIRTYCRVRKREPLIALGSYHIGGHLIDASAVPHRGGKGYRFEHPHLAEVDFLIN